MCALYEIFQIHQGIVWHQKRTEVEAPPRPDEIRYEASEGWTMLTDLYKGVELLSEAHQEIFIDQVGLGLAESPLGAQLPTLRVAATEERDL